MAHPSAGHGHGPPEGEAAAEGLAAGRAAFRAGRYREAARCFEASLARGGEGPPGAAHSNLSACWLALGEPAKALRAAEAAVKAEPGWRKGHYRKGLALEALAKFGAAQRAFAQALEIDPGDPTLRQCLARAERSLAAAAGPGLNARAPGARPPKPGFVNGDADPAAALRSALAALRTPGRAADELAAQLGEAGADREVLEAQLEERLRQLALRRGEGGGDENGGGEGGRGPHVNAHGNGEPPRPMSALQRARLRGRGGPPSRPGPAAGPARPFDKKRCAACGNVVHREMRVCSSCFRPLVDAGSYEPCHDAPVVGGAPGAAPPEPGPPPSTPPPSTRFPRPAVDALARHFATLGLPPGSGEAQVRAQYRRRVAEEHPDAGGEPGAHAEVCRAYEAISRAAGLREAGGAAAPPQAADTIFVAVPCYRDPEGVKTLASMFANAKRPDRLFVGVCWQYVREEPKSVTRLFPETRAYTAKVEAEVAKLLRQQVPEPDILAWVKQEEEEQRRLQRAEQRAEAAAHTRDALPAAYRSQVREIHLDALDAADGPSYARHLAARLYRGETFVALVDSHTRFAKDWDAASIDQLARCDAPKPVLTTLPLGYARAEPPAGTAAAVDTFPTDLRPPVITAVGFDPRGILRLGPQQRAAGDGAPVPGLFWSSKFSMCRAEPGFFEAACDPHLPYLRVGADVAAAAALFCAGWDFFAPGGSPPAFHRYGWKGTKWHGEDRRAGERLYAAPDEAAGAPEELRLQRFLMQASVRRVLQAVGAPDEEAAADLVAGPRRAGPRSVREFEAACGVDFRRRTVGAAARLGGQPAAALVLDRNGLLPNLKRGLSALDGHAFV